MGGKITIDSATMMNKGLELIEAHHLFGIPMDRIDVLVHPQSIIHGLITLSDGAQLAHLGHPDMRVPISWALHRGESMPLPTRTLDLAEVRQLTFEAPDPVRFPCLRLAREAQDAGVARRACSTRPTNAVHAFLDGQLSFGGIPEVVEASPTSWATRRSRTPRSCCRSNRAAREFASTVVERLAAS